MQPLISVVVPVYNVEAYLSDCISSIVNQTYKNLEIILVNDGSTDRCHDICIRAASTDNRITVINKENGGLSDARNTGIDLASGKYITFVDSDDLIATDMIEVLFRILSESNSDVSIISFWETENPLINDGKTGFSSLIDRRLKKTETFSAYGAVEELLYQRKFDTSACGKLYSAKLCKNHPYPKGKLYEDLFTTYKILLDCDQVVYCPEQLYYYRVNNDGIMHRTFSNRSFDELTAVDEIVDCMKQKHPKLLRAAYSRKFSSYSQVLRWMPEGILEPQLEEKKEQIWQFIKFYRWNMLFNLKARGKNRIAAALSLLGKERYHRIMHKYFAK